MSSSEFCKTLTRLALSEAEASRLMSVNPRSVRRWSEGSTEVPGPVEQALRAWLRLEEFGLVWRPDGVPIWDVDQAARFRSHAIELDALIQKVKKRGGPAAPWKVDLANRTAILGPVEVHFHVLANENFSPFCYEGGTGDYSKTGSIALLLPLGRLVKVGLRNRDCTSLAKGDGG